MSKKISLEEFIQNSSLIHKNSYDYSHVNFKNLHDMVNIVCKKHGIFIQKAYQHLYGKGCMKCYYDRKKSNIFIFINKSKEIYKDKYNYSKFEYIDSKSKSIIICDNNHELMVSPNRHLSGKTFCERCYQLDYKKKWIPILESIENFKYFLLKGDFVEIQCLKCSNIFTRKCSVHLKLKNCPYCRPNKDSLETFIKKSKDQHGELYDYSKVDYISSKHNINLICDKGHSFLQNANNHLQGIKCPKCNRFDLKENSLYQFIKSNTNIEVKSSNRLILKGKELDIYIPELGIAFEFNGLYWHSEIYKDKKYHIEKTKLCLDKNVNLIHVWEDDWDYKQNIVKSIILNKLGKSEKIYARKCEIKEVLDNMLIRNFLEKNHIQGFVGSKVKIGLFYSGELISLMTFGNLRKSLGQASKDGSFELLRFCNKLNISVIGGASKLFTFFIKKYNPIKIISYSDNSRGNGYLYEKLGFKLSHDSDPNYYWVINGIRKHRFGFRKDKLIKEGYDPNKTEIEIMNKRGYFRIFDCGSKKWIYSN
jgi:hypothetical protein